tara:strand:+ start:10609 stop:12201 length:1593 start_codon:yes stop_codon:yes gene_type:complete
MPAILLLAGFALTGMQECQAQLKDLEQLADAMASRIQQDCAANLPAAGKKHRIAVFKFADKNFKYDANTMGNLGNVAASLVQDKLKVELGKGATAGKYEVLDQSTVDLLFSATSTPKLGVFTKKNGNARKICQGVGIDVVVLSRFLFDDVKDVQKNPQNDVHVEAAVIFPGAEDSFSMSIPSKDVLLNASLGPLPPSSGGKGSGTGKGPGKGTGGVAGIPPNTFTPNKQGGRRLFDVEFFLRVNPGNKDDSDPSVWEPMPLKISTNPNSAGYGTFFLELDEAKHRNQRFKVRMNYRGPRPGLKDPLARERIYAAALTIDGLDSFYHQVKGKRGKPTLRAKYVHPHDAHKWVLTPPGFQIVPAPNVVLSYPAPYAWDAPPVGNGPSTPRADPRHKSLKLDDHERMRNGRFQQVNGPGHSIADVRGFQDGAKSADAFVFKTGGESLANLAGSVADVGEIKVYIYGEDLPLPKNVAAAAQAGVGIGKKLKNPVFPIKLRFDRDPHEVWTIKYRYAHSKNPPPTGLRPVTINFP